MSVHEFEKKRGTNKIESVLQYLNTGMTTQVEVKLGGVSDASVYGGSCWNVTTLANL